MKKLAALLSLLFVVVTLGGCVDNNTAPPASGGGNEPSTDVSQDSGGSGSSANARVLKFGHVNGDTHPCHTAALHMAELLEEKTGGRFTMDVYANSTLGGERDLIEGVQMGSVDLCYTAGTPLGNYVPEMLVTDLPYLIRDFEHADAVYHGEVGQSLLDAINQNQIKALTFVDIGFRNTVLVSRALTEPADINGIKIRTMENNLHLEAWRMMGADPMPMAWGEAFTALQQGAIDAVEMTNTHIVSNGVVDVGKYYAKTNHVYTPGLFLMSETLWNSLSSEDQQTFTDAAREAQELNDSLNRQLDQSNLDIIKDAGIEIYELDQQELQTLVQGVYDNHPEFDQVVEKIRNS